MQQHVIAGRYRLLELVGRGGMGRVWRSRDEILHREVAVKEVVPPHWLAEAERDELRLRTLREARTAARLNHPNVVRVYDVVQVDDRPWIVMEYVPSRTLQAVLEDTGPVDPVRAAGIGRALLAALRAAHDAGVLHRDVKPQNVLMAHDGRVMLTDFGLATFDGGDGLTTRPGMVLGSPQFVAPERAAEGVSSVEADLWSLGATLHAAVEGRSPYARSTAMATLAALATEPPDPAPHAGPLGPALEGLLRRDPRRRIRHDEADGLIAAAAHPPAPPATERRTVPRSVARSAAMVTPPPPWPGVPDRSGAGSGGTGSSGGLSSPYAPPDRSGAALPAAEESPAGSGEAEGGATRAAREAAAADPTARAIDGTATGSGEAECPATRAARTGQAAAAAGGDRPAARVDLSAVLARLLAWLRLTPRRVALVVTALGVAAATGIGTAFAIVDGEPAASPTTAPTSGSTSTADGGPDRPYGRDPGRPPPPDGGPPPNPPPFPCLRPHPVGEPIVARPGTADGGFRPPAGWTWYVQERWRVTVPVGWLRFTENGVACFRDPSSPRTLSVEPVTAEHPDPVAWLRSEERRLVDARTLPEYAKVRIGAAGGRGAQWECRWTAPFGERQHALRLLPGDDAGGWLLGWSTADDDWAAATGQFTVVRQSFRGRVTEVVSPT
ncbi:Serine/threonine protein kinase [Micromonospora purpureochromogenes]|uniref:non-specific serine/threonine protein kinase n=1 Tax=Micromonospora purpureochromogenes TaxID=47872 RepID=A0A1C4XIE6_9ACTN|nr:serine/threonine-protein kinase [Micromonospora purpureochromogenes]SCF08227.1 Serine/threonine protein kinase [Micromonospora purpureochromogenes]